MFEVTEKACRPLGPPGHCTYCGAVLGSLHKVDCALISKKVLVRMTVEYEVDVPFHWGKEEVEFHRNEGSWCADNSIEELERLAQDKGCLCGVVKFEYTGCDSIPFLSE